MNESRYRTVEEQLFAAAGVDPTEHRVALPSTGTTARLFECGDGAPVVFLHGGPMAAATWAYVAAAMPERRCILLERPGCGLSEPLRRIPGPDALATYVSQLTVDVLDALGIERASLVGSSFGGYSALCSAVAAPERIARVVLAGCPAFTPGWKRPTFFNLLRVPVLGRLLVAAPPLKVNARMFIKQMGHAAALADGRISPAMVHWTLAWQRHTDTVRNDVAMILKCAFDPSVDLQDDDLKRVQAPCLFLAGTQDPVGDAAVVTDVANRMRDAVVEVWNRSGHLPWLDDPVRAARSISAFT